MAESTRDPAIIAAANSDAPHAAPEQERIPLVAGSDRPRSIVDVLLEAGSDRKDCFRAWAAHRIAAGERWPRHKIIDALATDIASIDRLLSRQLDAILHDDRFRSHEASWRALRWLVSQTDAVAGADPGTASEERSVQVKLLQCSKRDLVRDFENATEFDQSWVWRKVYDEEFGTFGGDPFGLLVVDHAFGPHPADVECLGKLAELAAASFAPLIAAPSPDLLGAESFAAIGAGPRAEIYRQPEFIKWRALRDSDAARFVGLVLPRVLARRPYDGQIGPPDAPSEEESSWALRRFRYRETLSDPEGRDRVWASAAWAFAGVVVREFGRSGWFADIRGASRGREDGGLVANIPVETFLPDDADTLRGPTDVMIPETVERRLAAAGFVSLCGIGGDGRAVFQSNPSIHADGNYGSPELDANARVAGMLQYVLCASRIAHYLKHIARQKIGSVANRESLQEELHNWLHEYVSNDEGADARSRAALPLRKASVQVRDAVAGGYLLVMNLQPHFQLDDMAAAFELRTKIKHPVNT